MACDCVLARLHRRAKEDWHYTVAEFRRAAQANGWDSTVAELAVTKAAERRNAAAAGDRGEARARYRDGSLNDSQGGVEVWEIFYDTSDAGRRVCTLAPDVPDRPLDDRPWTWVALVGAEAEPPARPWPFVQFRNEDATGFYNTRGIPEILEVDQKEASTYRTTRAIAIDFAGKPFLSGQRHSTPFRFRAGEFLDGMEIVWAKNPGVDHVYQQDYSRNLAMKRVGSTQGAIASAAGADQRKTATEVNDMMASANGMSTDAVDRFAEPWAEMFDMMWTFMARTARANGGRCGLIQAAGKVMPSAAWSAEYCISAGVSGRSVNQSHTLAALTYIGQLAPVAENMTLALGPAAVKDFYLWIFNTLDTELARRVMAAAGSGDQRSEIERRNETVQSVETLNVQRSTPKFGDSMIKILKNWLAKEKLPKGPALPGARFARPAGWTETDKENFVRFLKPPVRREVSCDASRAGLGRRVGHRQDTRPWRTVFGYALGGAASPTTPPQPSTTPQRHRRFTAGTDGACVVK
jgi:hypothetical protein